MRDDLMAKTCQSGARKDVVFNVSPKRFYYDSLSNKNQFTAVLKDLPEKPLTSGTEVPFLHDDTRISKEFQV